MNTVTLQTIESFDVKPQKFGDEARYLCGLSESCAAKPRDAAHRSLCVNTRTGFYCCHRCHAKGKLKEFWEERPRLNKRQQAQIKLAAQFAAPPAIKNEKEAAHDHLSDNYAEKFKSYQAAFADSAAEKYLLKRGIPVEISRAAACGYAASWEHWEKREEKWLLIGVDKRVVFPIYNQHGELTAIHGRAIENDFFNSPKITKGDKSLGVFVSNPNVFEAKTIAVCEGAVDALALESCGVAAAAMTGTTAPDWLFKKSAFRSILLATDADEAGDKAADKLKMELEMRAAKTLRLRPRSAKDWAEVLEKIGAEKLRQHFAAFTDAASDETKVNAAWKLFVENRKEGAIFVAKLILDGEIRELLIERMK